MLARQTCASDWDGQRPSTNPTATFRVCRQNVPPWGQQDRNTRTALVPPKAKEFDNMTFPQAPGLATFAT